MKHPLVALAICLACHFSVAQKSITAQLTLQEGYGPFGHGSLWCWPLDAADKPQAYNVPADLTEYVIRSIDFQAYNTEYKKAIEQYHATRQAFLEAFKGKGYDTTLLTTQDYLHAFNVVMGTNRKAQLVVIVDVNHNASYSDDKVYTFAKLPTAKEQAQAKLPSVVLPFEFYDGKRIRKRPTKVYLNPYPGAWSVRFPDSTESKYFLAAETPQHKKGTLAIGKEKFTVFLYNHSQSLHYPQQDAEMMILPAGKTLAAGSNDKEFFKVGDTLTIARHQYRFSGASLFGDAIKLDYIGYSTRPAGAFEGQYAPQAKAGTVDGAAFDLSTYKGKYVLLDFWGTWCGPCIRAMPELAALHQKYKGENFVLVSVALDQDVSTVKAFNERLGMRWVNVFQKMNASAAERAVVEKFKVSVYPTLILIGPDGKILSRGKPAREVESRLAKALGGSLPAANTALPK